MSEERLRWWVVPVAAVLGIVTVVLIGWQVGWWLKADAVNREAEINRDSYSAQTVARDRLTRGIVEVYAIDSQIAASSGAQVATLQAQRHAVLGVVCRSATEITGPIHPDQAGFVEINCLAGAPAPGR